MRRILIVGSSGAGKSTLAVEMGRRLGLPVIHLDRLFWKPGWVMRSRDEFDGLLADALDVPEWIIDGNYKHSMDIRLQAADTMIWLDFPRWLCIWRVIARRLRHRGRTRADMGSDCPEKIDSEFLRYIWCFPRRGRPEILRNIGEHGSGKHIIILTTPREVAAFLASLPKGREERLHDGARNNGNHG